MSHDHTAQTILFPDLAENPVVVKLEEEHSSSDGGAVLLKGIDRSLGLTAALAGCLRASSRLPVSGLVDLREE